ncbi:MAG: AAA family ATPase [Myxococcota bacterium]
MKLNRIEVTNLNSLYGTHSVDLERALAGASLFLIHGPMGTGKSTLMDAVSLALFGKTPRLDNKRGRDDRGPARIMSRGTGACRAEIEFSKLESGGRARYRAVWTCRRARSKPDGNFQTPERSLEKQEDDGSWTTLVSDDRHKFVAPVFEAVLEGFTVDDFNRSMLLAQGRFDAFLKAEPGERAQILERLTQTAIYQQIGNNAAMIAGRHNSRLKRLRTLAAAPGGLQPEALEALKAEHELRTAALKEAQGTLAGATAQLTWLDTALQLRERLDGARSEGAAVSAAQETARPLLSRLKAHERCAAVQAFKALDTLQALRAEVSGLDEGLKALTVAAPGLKESEATAAKAAKRATRDTETAADDLERLRPQVERVTQADGAVKSATQAAAETRKASVAAVKKREEGVKACEVSRSAVVAQRAALDAAQAALVALIPDVTEPGYERARQALQAELLAAREHLRRVEAAVAPARQVTEAEKALTAQRARQNEGVASTKALDGRVKAATLEVSRCGELLKVSETGLLNVARIAELAVHRDALIEGEECPLCGAESHPWTGDAERAKADAVIAETVASAEADRDKARSAAQAATEVLTEVQGERQRLAGRLEQLAGELEEAEKRRELLVQAAQKALGEAGLCSDSELDAALVSASKDAKVRASVLETLEAAFGAVRAAESALREGEATVKGKEALVAEYRQQEEALADTLMQQGEVERAARAQAEAEGASLEILWQSIVASEDGRPEGLLPPDEATPAQWLQAQHRWLEHTRGAEKLAANAHRLATEAVQKNATLEASMTEQRAKKDTTRGVAQQALEGLLVTLELEDVEALVSQRLDEETLQGALSTRKGLEERRIRNDAMLKERQEALAVHDTKCPEGLSSGAAREPLEAAVARADAETKEAAKQHEETTGQLKAHELQVARHQESRRELEEAEKAARVWRTLHDIIGQNDGGRFQQFAQALNLGQLLEKANVHLRRLNERYRLVPRKQDGLPTLDFDLEDLWQAGETVSPQSLSGGERFLVSLALALGLSDFRGANVTMPVETLLLDEGFGTLDPDTLSVAMAALSQLQADGRQVGIISHVVGLTERIDARVEVRPLGGGRSELHVTG